MSDFVPPPPLSGERLRTFRVFIKGLLSSHFFLPLSLWSSDYVPQRALLKVERLFVESINEQGFPIADEP